MNVHPFPPARFHRLTPEHSLKSVHGYASGTAAPAGQMELAPSAHAPLVLVGAIAEQLQWAAVPAP